MVLYRPEPAGLRFEGISAIFEEVFAFQLFGFLASVDDRPVERIGIDIKHRAFYFRGPMLNLRIFGAPPQPFAVVRYFLFDLNCIAAGRKAEALFDRYTITAFPGQRNNQLVRAVQLIAFFRAGENRLVVWFVRSANGAQSGLNQSELVALGAQ